MSATTGDPWALVAYSVVMTVTPGPNNLLLMSSGLSFGLYRTAWHVAGILSGVLLLIALAGAGIGAVFALFPGFQGILKAVGSAYMLYLAWRLWDASGKHDVSAARPIGYLEALAFQFVNPKTWMMAMTVVAAFVPAGDGYWDRLIAAGLIFQIVALPCVVLWVIGGASLRAWTGNATKLRRINRVMALLCASTAALFWI
jgi:threonine/homoserine/homoserine lactone efflux protein